MLDRTKLFKELARVADTLFPTYADEHVYARALWESLVNDPLFAQRVASGFWSLSVPAWSGPLNALNVILQSPAHYQVMAIDGSQIYPDRHQGTFCYLINIGLVVLTYGMSHGRAYLNSDPYVFTEQDDKSGYSSIDLINCLREAFEFEKGYAYALQQKNNDILPQILLFDGSLIFWHLEAKDPTLRRRFITRYIHTLEELYQAKIVHAAYMSMPHHREVSNLMRLALSDFDRKGCQSYQAIDHIHDTTVMNFFMQPETRSTVFKYTGTLSTLYPERVCPHFFYLHNGYEIGRVEIPAWIADDEDQLNVVAAVLLDQVRKGKGYPIALAEAHEQAVVKGPDRDFFYQVITKLRIEQKRRIVFSQKNLKKRSIGI